VEGVTDGENKSDDCDEVRYSRRRVNTMRLTLEVLYVFATCAKLIRLVITLSF